MKEKLIKKKNWKRKRKERIIRKNISNLFHFLEMNFHFLIIILKTYLEKRNEREIEKEKEKECKTEWKKKERQKEEKEKEMGILYSYIVKDVMDEMKLFIHPSVLSSISSSIQTEQIYI